LGEYLAIAFNKKVENARRETAYIISNILASDARFFHYIFDNSVLTEKIFNLLGIDSFKVTISSLIQLQKS